MIPDFQTLMRPVLQILMDKKIHKAIDIRGLIIENFKLSEEERNELLPGGSQAKIDNRVHWALSYLKKANLVQSPVRGSHEITQNGLKIFESAPERITIKFLKTIPEFKQWQDEYKLSREEAVHNPEIGDTESTPDELLESSYSRLIESLSIDLIEKIKTCSPTFFENLVVDLLIKMGYGGSRAEAGKVIGKSGDGGIDGLIKEDKLGLDTIYIQAKKWEAAVPVSQIRDFAGSLMGKKAKKGIFITTSSFPKSAYEFVANIESKIVLIDGNELADLMIEHNVGVAIKRTYEVKRLDIDYFEEN